MNNKYIIYSLIDPRNNEIRYIGKSEQGSSRLKEHLKPSSLKNNTHKDNWIKQLLSLNLKPEFYILEVLTNSNDLFEAEEFWYSYYKSLGCRLTNLTHCGQGTTGYTHKQETIQKLKDSAAKRDKSAYKIPHNKKVNIVIDDELYRNCASCKSNKKIEEYAWNDKRKQFQSYCNNCKSNYDKKWHINNPYVPLLPEEYNETRISGSIAGGEAMKAPDKRLEQSIRRSKSISATHTDTNEVLTFSSALKAKEAGFQNSNIGQAIKFNKPYKNYIWKFL